MCQESACQVEEYTPLALLWPCMHMSHWRLANTCGSLLHGTMSLHSLHVQNQVHERCSLYRTICTMVTITHLLAAVLTPPCGRLLS